MKNGDKVVCIVNNVRGLTLSKVYTIQKVDKHGTGCDFYRVLNDQELYRWFKDTRFSETEPVRKTNANTYNFNINHISQVDIPAVLRDLSYANPVAILKVRVDDFVLFHWTLWAKLAHCSDSEPLVRRLDAVTSRLPSGLRHTINLPEVLKIVKEIKKSKHTNPVRGTVTVTIPKGF